MDSNVRGIIKVATTATGVAGVGLGVTGGDTLVVAGAWGAMMLGIAKHHGVELDHKTCVKTCAGIVASLAGFHLGCKILTWSVSGLLAVCTLGTSLVLACGINGLINALITYRLGVLFDKMYGEQGVKTAVFELGSVVLRSLFHIPSKDEFEDFMSVWRG